MSLASSTSAQKAAAEKKRQQDRRLSVVRNRTSLPSSITSSTVATKMKAERRRSLRRQSSSGSLASTENRNNGIRHSYSPPETRSAKKKKTNQNFLNNSSLSGSVLNFSPPDQKENERREKERIAHQEADRQRRVQQARANGQLLLFSPSGRGQNQYLLDMSPSAEGATASVASSSTANSDRTKQHQDDLLLKLSDEVSRIRQSQAEANSSKRDADDSLLKKMHEMLSTDTLKQTNEKLMTDLQELNTKYANDKEAFATEKTRLEMALSQSQEKIKHLDNLQQVLRKQTDNLQLEKNEHGKTVESLEEALRDAKSKLEEDKTMLESMQTESKMEKEAMALEVKQLQLAKNNLLAELQDLQRSNHGLEDKIASYQQIIEKHETVSIPQLEQTLHNERDAIARLEGTIETRNLELEDRNTAIANLKMELESLKAKNEEERQSFQVLNEDSAKAFAKMDKAAKEKDEIIAGLREQIETQLADASKERSELTESNERLQEVVKNLEAQQKQLNDALEETIVQLDKAEEDKKDLEDKLAKALQKLQEAKAAAESKDSEMAGVMENLTNQVVDERQRREQAEYRLTDVEKSSRDNANQAKLLEKELKETQEERDLARSNMLGFNDREEDLYKKLREGDRIRREMHSKLMQLMGNIRVFVRVRPVLPGEKSENTSIGDKKRKREDNATPFRYPGVYDRDDKKPAQNVMSSISGCDLTKNLIEVQEPYKDRGGLKDRRKKWRFGFDQVFSPQAGQDEVWDAVEPLIQSAVDGFNVTVFAYGQTGSGKTYTMIGEEEDPGLIGRSVRKMFTEKRELESLSRGDTQVSMSVELLEVYNEKVRDLLSSDKKQELKVTSNEVVGNVVVQTSTEEEVMKVMALAQSRRCVKATDSNTESSRSHMIFTLHFHTTTKNGTIRTGRLNICDLAGSERLSKSGANNVGGALLEESKNINKSLSVLSNVIERLQAGDNNVPFRESKLTFLLKNCLSGNSKTLAIVCCNPMVDHVNESLCSLRFAEKVNRVDLKAQANFSC